MRPNSSRYEPEVPVVFDRSRNPPRGLRPVASIDHVCSRSPVCLPSRGSADGAADRRRGLLRSSPLGTTTWLAEVAWAHLGHRLERELGSRHRGAGLGDVDEVSDVVAGVVSGQDCPDHPSSGAGQQGNLSRSC